MQVENSALLKVRSSTTLNTGRLPTLKGPVFQFRITHKKQLLSQLEETQAAGSSSSPQQGQPCCSIQVWAGFMGPPTVGRAPVVLCPGMPMLASPRNTTAGKKSHLTKCLGTQQSSQIDTVA